MMRSLSGGTGDVERGEERRRGGRKEGKGRRDGRSQENERLLQRWMKIREMGESVMISLGVDGG